MVSEEGSSLFCKTCGAQLYADSKYCPQCGMVFIPQSNGNGLNISRMGASPDVRLFQVYTQVNNFSYSGASYDNLKITWFVVNRPKPQVPFDKVIANYCELPPKDRFFPEHYIMERFLEEEAEQLKRYLIDSERYTAYVDECLLPVSSVVRGYSDMPRVPGTDIIQLHKRSSFNLPFKVEGIFNVKMADERVMSDDNITTVTKIDYDMIRKFVNK